jgi:hypothetical protein
LGGEIRKENTLKTERKREDNIKKLLEERGWKSTDETDLAKNKCRAVVNTVMNLRVT